MFLNQNNLNEGDLTASRVENKRREFYEGENPKLNINSTNWQTTDERSHVNSNWQKLRK